MAEPKRNPEIPEAIRLETVRNDLGIGSVRDFWQRLGEKEGSGVGYASAKSYHIDRIGPVKYYARVAERFGVSLEWLLLGYGPMWSKELGRVQEESAGMMKILPSIEPSFFILAGPAAITAMHHAVNKVLNSLPAGELENLFAEDVAELAARLIRLAGEPAKRLGFKNPPSYDTVTAYYQNLFQAMTLSTPGHGRGKPFNRLMDALAPWATPEEEETNGEA